MSVLDDLEKLDWISLGYPDMMIWLRQLKSVDDDEREAGYNSLYEYYMYDDVRLYGVAHWLVPYLIELLSDENIEKKGTPALLLMQFVSESYMRSSEDKIAEKVQQEAAKAIDLYVRLLDADDPDVWRMILEMVPFLDHGADRIIPKLVSMLSNDVISKQLWATETLGRMIAKHPHIAYQQIYIEALQSNLSHPDLELCLVTALAMTRILKKETPQAVIDMLIDKPITPDPTALTLSAIKLVSELETERAVKSLLKMLTYTNNEHYLINLLLSLINIGLNQSSLVELYSITKSTPDQRGRWDFAYLSGFQPPISSVYSLTDLQKEILRALIAKDELWASETNIFSLHGLPDTREELIRLVQ